MAVRAAATKVAAARAKRREIRISGVPLALRRLRLLRGARVLDDVLLHQLTRLVVADLHRRRLHQVAGRGLSAPETPLLSASFASRTASITMPAEFGQSQTELELAVERTSPKADPSSRMYAHLRSVSHGT